MVCCVILSLILALVLAVVRPFFGIGVGNPLAWRAHGEAEAVSHASKLRDYYRSRIKSILYALNGLVLVIREEPNARIHLAVASLVITLAIMLDATTTQWAMLCFAIGLVISAEIFNSAIEALCDKLSPGYDDAIGRVKDAGGGY
ncbi:MAG: diacylglycerol kinase family protein, partial [Pseudomonadota bacterium]